MIQKIMDNKKSLFLTLKGQSGSRRHCFAILLLLWRKQGMCSGGSEIQLQLKSGVAVLWFSTVSVVPTRRGKTNPSATRSTIVRVTQTCEILASLQNSLQEKKKSEVRPVILVESLTPQYKSMWAQLSVWERSSRQI